MEEANVDYLYEDLEDTKEDRVSSVLTSIADKVRDQLNLEDEIERKEKELESLKQRYNQISMVDIPHMFQQAGVNSLVLFDKYKVSVFQDVRGKVLDQRAFSKLLETRGQENLNKTSLVLGKVSADISKKIASYACEIMGEYPEIDSNIHAQTLKKWLRENVALDNPREEVDADCGGKLSLHELDGIVDAYTFNKTKVSVLKKNS